MTPTELDRMEKGLVCLVPKESAVNESSMLLTCHEYSVCDCTVLRLIADLRKCVEALEEISKLERTAAEVARECLSSLSTPHRSDEP